MPSAATPVSVPPSRWKSSAAMAGAHALITAESESSRMRSCSLRLMSEYCRMVSRRNDCSSRKSKSLRPRS